MRLYNFFEASASFELGPLAAIQYFLDKGLRATFAWQDMVAEEHDTAFTVAKMLDTDLLATVDNHVQQAIVQGTTLAEFKEQLIPRLQKAGWWGRGEVVDPATGKVLAQDAQLGSAWRLETIFRSNLQSAYSVGTWQQIQQNILAAPYLMYDAIEDDRVRPEHLKWNSTVAAVSDPFWNKHYPPNGWNCRCGVVQMSKDEVKSYGLTITTPRYEQKPWINPRTGKTRMVPTSIDPGWDHNPGITRQQTLKQTKTEKRLKLFAAQQRALGRSDSAIEQAKQHYRQQLRSNTLYKHLKGRNSDS